MLENFLNARPFIVPNPTLVHMHLCSSHCPEHILDFWPMSLLEKVDDLIQLEVQVEGSWYQMVQKEVVIFTTFGH